MKRSEEIEAYRELLIMAYKNAMTQFLVFNFWPNIFENLHTIKSVDWRA